MTVSRDNSLAIYRGIKAAGVKSISALPETWLVYLLQLAEDDPDVHLIEVAKEEEAIGMSHTLGIPKAVFIPSQCCGH